MNVFQSVKNVCLLSAMRNIKKQYAKKTNSPFKDSLLFFLIRLRNLAFSSAVSPFVCWSFTVWFLRSISMKAKTKMTVMSIDISTPERQLNHKLGLMTVIRLPQHAVASITPYMLRARANCTSARLTAI